MDDDMQRYFLGQEAQISERHVLITGSDYHHITHVMRMKPGDQVQVVIASIAYLAKITSLSEGQVELELVLQVQASGETSIPLTLLQGLPKGDKIDLVIRQAAEIGVSQIIIFQAQRSVVKIAVEKRGAKLLRWQKIAKEAAELAQRTQIPEVQFAPSLEIALSQLDSTALLFMPYELQGGGLPTIKTVLQAQQPTAAAFVIGPEGGFSEAEVALVSSVGGRLLTLGRRILRTETAGLVVASLLLYEWDQMGVN